MVLIRCELPPLRFAALLSRRRWRLDREIEQDFPHLPPGCSLQLERVAREHVLAKVRAVLNDLNHFIPECLQTWEQEQGGPLSFGRFVNATGLSPTTILARRTWSEWLAMAHARLMPDDPDLAAGRKALARLALRTDPDLLEAVRQLDEAAPPALPEPAGTALHYLLWGQKGSVAGTPTLDASRARWRQNPSLRRDAAEIAAWRLAQADIPTMPLALPFACSLRLHAAYGSAEIKSLLALATLEKTGPTGQGVLHAKELKCYVHLVTFCKDERDFSPTTRYQDYPISRTLLHWESQSTITQASETGQNYRHFRERGYTILFFARQQKRVEGETAPFYYLGPAQSLIRATGDRPIAMVWELAHPMPAVLFEEARAV